ncbi:serine-rich adhesin for platelets-like [Teleopsis dalmanni]|uniref:serine-rich adhesin for platelets-like n=1 Tax=Teleopsis dalmanni TaxID=139649 RepID=UPI0018CF7EB4|nr:serine-rich adhesin for platelets-like [Teleopsis dalmanni]
MFKIPQILFMFAAVAFCAPYENQDTKLKDIDNKYEKQLEPIIKNFANSFTKSNAEQKMAEENLNFFYMQSLYAGALSMRAMQTERSSDIPTTTATTEDETTFLPHDREMTTEKSHKSGKEEESATQINIFVSPHIDVQNSQTSYIMPKNQNDEQSTDQYEYPKSRKEEVEATFGAMFKNVVNKETIFSSRSQDENAIPNLDYGMEHELQKEIQTKLAATVPQSILKQSEHTTENGFIFGSMKKKVDDPLTSQEQLENKSFSSSRPYEEESRIVTTNEPVKKSIYVTDRLESNIRKPIADESIPQEPSTAKSSISDHLHVTDSDKADSQIKKTIAANKETATDTSLPQARTEPKNSDAAAMSLVNKAVDAYEPILTPEIEQKFSNEQEDRNNVERKEIAPVLLTTETPSAESAKDVLTVFVPEDSTFINNAKSKTMTVTQNENNLEATTSATVNVLSTTKGKVIDETTLIPEGKKELSGAESLSNANIFDPKELDAQNQSEIKNGLPTRVSANGEALKVIDIDAHTTITEPAIVESVEKQIESSNVQNLNEAVFSRKPTSNWFENGLSPETKEYLTTTPDMDVFERTETRTVNVIKNPVNHRTTTKKVDHKTEAAKNANIPLTTTDTTDVTTTTEKPTDLREVTTVVDGNMNVLGITDATTINDDKNSDITTISSTLNSDSPTESNTTDISNIKETTVDSVTAESDTTQKPANIADIIQAMAKYVMTNGTVDMLNNSESKQRNDEEITTPITIITDATTKFEMTEDTTLLPEQQTEVFIIDKSELENGNSEIEMVSATTMDAIISSSVKPGFSSSITTVETTNQASNLDIILLPPSLVTETHAPIKTPTTESVAYATTMRDIVVPKTIVGATLPRKPTTEPDELELQIMKPTPRVESTLPFTTENTRSVETTLTAETTTYKTPISETESYGTATNVATTEMNPLRLSTVQDSTAMFSMSTDDDQTEQSRISESTTLTNKMPETAATEISEVLDITKVEQQVGNSNNPASMKKVLTEPEITTQTIPLRRKPPVKISRILSDEGVEVYYGYSNVERN